jgi:UDP-glucose 4-epimerase
MRCLVLGGRGFVGSHLIDSLLELGYQVRCFDRPHVVPLGDSYIYNPNFELYEGDFVSEADISQALVGCEVCYHLISTTLPKSSNADPIFDVETNVLGTVRLLTLAVKSGLKKIIFVSSGGTVYGVPACVPIPEVHPTDPECAYGISKLAIEKYLRLFHHLHGLDYTILRLSNPYGERQRTRASQGVIAVFMGKVLRGEPVEIWGDGSVIRDYIHISDVVDAMLMALEQTYEERVYNIGAGYGRNLNEVLVAIEKATGCLAICRYLPGRAFDVPESVLCIARAKASLNWSPKVDFEHGIERLAAWLLEHPSAD